ncbi:phosphotransferase [Candidatus Roizmanbacteria bacterium]|nr:phosphotransferase [Candidatus Roizmanbacteria bacterium]
MSKEVVSKSPIDRLNYTGDLTPVISRAAQAYRLGEARSFSVIPVGYEDCNVVINTPTGEYVAKIFTKDRHPEELVRYCTIMEQVIAGGVNHPPLLHTQDNQIVYSDAETLPMVVMPFIRGNNFLELDHAPTSTERRAILEQAAMINTIPYHPTFLHDSWAIPNIYQIYAKVSPFVPTEELELIQKAIIQYQTIPVSSLPHALVHGDFTKANVLKGDVGKIYVLDFSVANWYPRIQELAVIAANLLYDRENPQPLKQTCELVAEEYSQFNPLTDTERQYLYAYALTGVAMTLMGAHQEKYIKGNDSKETDYWLDLGRNGLRRELHYKL